MIKMIVDIELKEARSDQNPGRGNGSWRMNGSNKRERAHRLHNDEDSGGGPGSQRRNSRDIIVGDLWDQMIATMLLMMMLW